MRLAFAGTPEFAARALVALLAAGHELALVLTQPDRPAGRGLRPAASAVKRLALERALPLFQPATLKDPGALERLAATRPAALVVAAYGLMLPPRALELARHGALNIHASLLPRWRGAAPIQRALLAGDRETGITIMQMDAGLDTGPLIAQHRLAIAPDDDFQSLHERLAALGAAAIVAALDELAAGRMRAVAQGEAGASYAHKLGKHEAELDWSRPCAELERKVRALRPAPGARSWLRGRAIKLWRARCVPGAGRPGTVLECGAAGVRIACGEGALEASELQRAGGERLAAAEFLRGFALERGERLGAAR
ncbi:MAG: methionyl-tRNA formyltransferase [Betaproteobacteria bacterium]|nr:methionyl-tRNA formyltransferase [Betaproteobacteria bacterium]